MLINPFHLQFHMLKLMIHYSLQANNILHCNQAPPFRDLAETLIEEIKILLLSDMEDNCSDSDDLMKRLQMVDIIECLGIDRHFQHEIKVALDYVYRLSIYIDSIYILE